MGTNHCSLCRWVWRIYFCKTFCLSFLNSIPINHSTNVQDLEIYVGSIDVRSGGTFYKVEKYKIHDDYNNPPYSHDIGLIRVQGSISFNDKVQPINYSPDRVPDGAGAQLSGWGRLDVNLIFFYFNRHDINLKHKIF